MNVLKCMNVLKWHSLTHWKKFFRQASRAPRKESAPAVKVSLEEAMVLKALPDGDDIHVDSLVRAVKLPVAKVNALLVQLRLKRKVKFLPGNRVSAVRQ